MQINWARIKGTAAVVGVVLLLLVAAVCFAKDSAGVLLPLMTVVVSGVVRILLLQEEGRCQYMEV